MTAPKGKLIPIGGHEARSPADEAAKQTRQPTDFFRNGVLAEVLSEIKGTASRLVIITAASEIPEEMGQLYIDAFGQLGCRQIDCLHIPDPSQTDRPGHHQKLAQADGVLFTGGDQAALAEKLVGSALMTQLTTRYQQEPFVIAGTSAGAAAMAKFMIKEGDSGESLLKGMAEIQPGLALLPSLIVDTHFAERGRFPRLVDALLQHPGLPGLGLSEDTGTVITNGNTLRVIGSGSAFLIDTRQTDQTNYLLAGPGESVSSTNLQVHILARGAQYILDK